MTKPSECKWCGCGPVQSTSGSHVKFTCRSVWMADGDCWACSSQCCDWMRDRIQRAVEAIRAANRYYLLGEVALIPDETGNLTQACVLDDVAAILEGKSDESDGQTD
jgi:hypothetical protein